MPIYSLKYHNLLREVHLRSRHLQYVILLASLPNVILLIGFFFCNLISKPLSLILLASSSENLRSVTRQIYRFNLYIAVCALLYHAQLTLLDSDQHFGLRTTYLLSLCSISIKNNVSWLYPRAGKLANLPMRG